MSSKDIKELTVTELFATGEYIIPIYQRNYAWGEPEVEQLIQDVMDVATQSDSDDRNYYIGSLVAYQRDHNQFETIDGQQRHTTLSIILSVLKNEHHQELKGVERVNLGFDSRKKSHNTLRRLFLNPDRNADEPEERTIRSAYEVAKRYLSKEKNDVVAQFADYLLNKVKILRVVVPEDTDLNHYFEIMNNRGEQLEKHEVLKARLMNELDNDAERICFAKVWDACADMNRYVQLGIDAKIRGKVFGQKWDKYPDDFEVLCDKFSTDDTSDGQQTLASIIAKPEFKGHRTKEASEEAGTFSSIINFSNFLLHVLRVITEEDVPLDDKRLLNTFDEHFGNDAEEPLDPRDFILELLLCRMLFDRYIIKRENDEDWSLKTLTPYEKSFSYVNTAGDDNQSMIMVLSMFHVSFPALVYKHWLNAALSYLWSESSRKTKVSTEDYMGYMEGLCDTFFYGRFGVVEDDEPIDYFELIYGDPEMPEEFDTSHLDQGTNVQNFLFNRLDYLLWKRLDSGETFKDVNMDYVNKRLNGFSFSFRTSVEHYYPQNPLGAEPMADVDRFGNLCLISRSNNSKLSNYLPTAKKEHYEKATTVESLKQVFMMSYSDWGNESEDTISKHENMMVEALCGQ